MAEVNIIKTLREGSKGRVSRLAFTPDGKKILCGIGPYASKFELWDISTESRLFKLKTPTTILYAITPDEKYLISGGVDKIRVLDLNTRQVIWKSMLGLTVTKNSRGLQYLMVNTDENTVILVHHKKIVVLISLLGKNCILWILKHNM